VPRDASADRWPEFQAVIFKGPAENVATMWADPVFELNRVKVCFPV
jgi:hypothetical protein